MKIRLIGGPADGVVFEVDRLAPEFLIPTTIAIEPTREVPPIDRVAAPTVEVDQYVLRFTHPYPLYFWKPNG